MSGVIVGRDVGLVYALVDLAGVFAWADAVAVDDFVREERVKVKGVSHGLGVLWGLAPPGY